MLFFIAVSINAVDVRPNVNRKTVSLEAPVTLEDAVNSNCFLALYVLALLCNENYLLDTFSPSIREDTIASFTRHSFGKKVTQLLQFCAAVVVQKLI